MFHGILMWEQAVFGYLHLEFWGELLLGGEALLAPCIIHWSILKSKLVMYDALPVKRDYRRFVPFQILLLELHGSWWQTQLQHERLPFALEIVWKVPSCVICGSILEKVQIIMSSLKFLIVYILFCQYFCNHHPLMSSSQIFVHYNPCFYMHIFLKCLIFIWNILHVGVYLRKYEKNKNAVGNSVYCFAHVMLTFAKGKCKLDLCGQGYCHDGTCWDAVMEISVS
jgi:hypothetical protein